MNMGQEFTENEIVAKMEAKIKELEKESLDIDMCRGKGISLSKSSDIGDRQREIERELSALKTEYQKVLHPKP